MHMMVKMHFRKFPPTIFACRDFFNNDNANFINSKTESILKDPHYFYKVCIEVRNKHAPCKKKCLWK